MSESKMREEFESKFPVPLGLFWNGAFEVYHALDPDHFQSVVSMLYRARWDAWQASREALVIELPAVRPELVSSGEDLRADGEAASWNIWVGDKLAKIECRTAIEALGLKVSQ